jgi:hypothetical protein
MVLPFFNNDKKSSGTSLPGEHLITIPLLSALALLAVLFSLINTLFLGGIANTQPTIDLNQMVCHVNKIRVARNLPPLGISESLNKAAEFHSRAQAYISKMSHHLPGEPELTDRIYSRSAENEWRRVAENVAYGYQTEYDVMMGWMNSPGHRANILGDFTHIGASLAISTSGTPYWTQNFGNDGKRVKYPVCPGNSNSNWNSRLNNVNTIQAKAFVPSDSETDTEVSVDTSVVENPTLASSNATTIHATVTHEPTTTASTISTPVHTSGTIKARSQSELGASFAQTRSMPIYAS